MNPIPLSASESDPDKLVRYADMMAASHPAALNLASDPTSLPAFHRLATHLMN